MTRTKKQNYRRIHEASEKQGNYIVDNSND